MPVVIVGTEASIDDALTLFEMEYQLGFRSVSKIVTEEDMLHSAQGLGTLEWHYADIFRNSGFAVLLVDSFRSRGLGRIREDQTRVSEATILTDAFAALAYLAKHRQIDPDRIGVVGFSKGGMPALYSANSGIAGMIDTFWTMSLDGFLNSIEGAASLTRAITPAGLSKKKNGWKPKVPKKRTDKERFHASLSGSKPARGRAKQKARRA